MSIQSEFTEMPHQFVVFRTFDRVWDSGLYTREFSPLELDRSYGGVNFIFQTDHVVSTFCGAQPHTNEGTTNSSSLSSPDTSIYLKPHRGHTPVFLGQQSVTLSTRHGRKNDRSQPQCCQPLSVFSSTGNPAIINENHGSENLTTDSVCYFVLPKYRCTVVVDAHVAACMNHEYNRSKTFRRRLCRQIRKSRGFRYCMPEYEKWTQKERDAWDNYLSIPSMLDVIAVWPHQKVDYACSYRILSLLGKHITLEESLAWLSTLGGAHSSLGETFIDHAVRAGEISIHQMKLAKELGNEIMIARCYLYWAWSLLQRDYFTKCKVCIINTWRYVQKIKCSDKVLANMCQAVWNRLQYKKSLVCKSRARCGDGSRDPTDPDADGPGSGNRREKGEKDSSSHYKKTLNSSRLRTHPVRVC